ncbi:proline-rich protein 12-like [Balaenoptera acutorostrata]|uniref:Proline-rich protein 12-like n=1 Tax=Balaenoptera acutorostrata TaxID=9767 RepID=A0ABM3TFP0_BALAC|nr:proline-rich protein 12-like [Balaenoptera acutorostrata]
MYFSLKTDQREAAEGSRISRLKRKGDGKEGGRGRGWLGDASGNAAAPTAAGSGSLTARARRTGRRRSRESVRGGRWRRLLSSLRQEQLQAAAGSSGHGGGGGGGSSLQTPGSGSSTAPHTPGTWEPSNRFRPSGPPPPSKAPARPPSRPSLLHGPAQEVSALCPQPGPCQWLRGRLLLASFLPLSLGPGGGGGGGGGGSGSTSLHSPGSGAALCEECRSAQPPSFSPLPLPPPTRPPPPSSPTQPYTAQRPRVRVTGVWESPAEPSVLPLRQGSRSPSGTNHGCRLFADPPGKSRST